MARLGSDASPWTARFPVAVDATALGSPTNKDVEIAIPVTLEKFWGAVDSAGYQIRITAADGVTELPWGRTGSWSKTNRTGGLKMLGASGSPTWQAQVGMNLLYVYVGNVNIVSDTSSGTATATPLTGYLCSAAPVAPIPVAPEPPDRTQPTHWRAIKTTEALHLWLDLTGRLSMLRRPYAGGREFEEPSLVVTSGLDDGGAVTAITASKTRFVEDDGFYVRVTLAASTLTTGDDVTAVVTITTTSPDGSGDAQIIEQRILVRVRNVDDQ